MAKSLPLHSQCIGMQIRNMFLIPISITLKAGDSWSVVISFLFQQKNRKKKQQNECKGYSNFKFYDKLFDSVSDYLARLYHVCM